MPQLNSNEIPFNRSSNRNSTEEPIIYCRCAEERKAGGKLVIDGMEFQVPVSVCTNCGHIIKN